MSLNPKIWGPHYWFVLHTIALTYPVKANETVRKKYYDFIENLPIFIPIENIGNYFSKLLDKYPVTPYLDSRESFIKWIYFIHNEVNKELGYEELTLSDSLEKYYKQYENSEKQFQIKNNTREKYIYFSILLLLIITTINIYKKS
jgi:fumarate reductase subunit C